MTPPFSFPVTLTSARLRVGYSHEAAQARFVAFPPRRFSARLANGVDAYTRIGSDKIRNAQLPAKIVTAGGITLERPGHWS